MKNRVSSISLLVALTLSTGLIGCTGEYVAGTIEYTLSVSGTEGGEVIAPGEGSFAYHSGTVVGLVARPASGYRFVKWIGDVCDIANMNAASTAITMNDDYSVIANFEIVDPTQYNLIISSTVGGSVSTPGEGTFSYDGGTVVDLVATQDSDYQFVNWTGSVHAIADINAAWTTITINDDYSAIANFEERPSGQYALTISSTVGGSVSTPGQGTFVYYAGAVVELVVLSEEGYKFFNWTGDIENVETIADVNPTSSTRHWQTATPFSITMEGNYAITANFIPRWIIPTG